MATWGDGVYYDVARTNNVESPSHVILRDAEASMCGSLLRKDVTNYIGSHNSGRVAECGKCKRRLKKLRDQREVEMKSGVDLDGDEPNKLYVRYTSDKTHTRFETGCDVNVGIVNQSIRLTRELLRPELMRRRFEDWLKRECVCNPIHIVFVDGHYTNADVEKHWRLWQSALLHLVQDDPFVI
jgi:hypothetical protein